MTHFKTNVFQKEKSVTKTYQSWAKNGLCMRVEMARHVDRTGPLIRATSFHLQATWFGYLKSCKIFPGPQGSWPNSLATGKYPNSRNNSRPQILFKQECTPVGCILTTAGWAASPPLLLRQTPHPVNRQTLLKTLPSLAVGKYSWYFPSFEYKKYGPLVDILRISLFLWHLQTSLQACTI